jgi:ribosomal protein S18 acetylase RimI-like enzyme
LGIERAKSLNRFTERLGHSIKLDVLHEGELVAIGGLVIGQVPKQAHKASIQGVYVRPQLRRRGIARRLLEALIELARQQGVEILQLAVMADSAPARRLYADLGFVEYGLEKHALKHEERYYHDSLMALDLSVMT